MKSDQIRGLYLSECLHLNRAMCLYSWHSCTPTSRNVPCKNSAVLECRCVGNARAQIQQSRNARRPFRSRYSFRAYCADAAHNTKGIHDKNLSLLPESRVAAKQDVQRLPAPQSQQRVARLHLSVFEIQFCKKRYTKIN